ncbi:hypothetical protein SYNPS1DRAFT_32706 [Syncephalis pseudoplumigaleata]|uniref:Coronin n=1 Tax=Syncephalis pseudoplumigaleata TaxID=1712513 RepID=A0A4P9Z220_9FUNG|nr:hypothetical protein SYNPS1DRAFT_32706 [Syncephalis pseudoplumigaleata]|eukprot:RKP26543.1 hypothetical protein SYNPS1DRAFT_32706 [Syncephalis pseudoplumigaleata]
MSRFVRASKFRHVYGTAARRENCYDNVRVSNNAWDSNLVSVNAKYIAVNWEAAGGGAFAVIPLRAVGRLPSDPPLFHGHSSAVLDTDFANFDDQLIASASEDGKVMIWRVPDGDYEESQTEPLATLAGHQRKVGHVLFHPTADQVLASSSADATIRLWDVGKAMERQVVDGHHEVIQSITWNYNGSLMASTCRDKKLRILDVRANQVVQETDGHQGIKGARVVWLGEHDRLATTGFARSSDRQLALWDTRQMEKPLKMKSIDASSGVLMPYYDADVSMLYLADGNIRYFEYENDDLFLLSEYKSSEPQRGIAFMPKYALNAHDCEVARAYKVLGHLIEPISFVVPRRADTFQADIFPPTPGQQPAQSADDYFNGQDANPLLLDLETGGEADAAQKLRRENAQLREDLAKREARVKFLEDKVKLFFEL